MSTPLTPATLQPCTCCDETWCPACTASRIARKPWNPGAGEAKRAADQRYYVLHREERLAYGARYRATHRPPRRDAEVSPLPAALVTAALSGIPPLWRHADVFGPGPYLWHCKVWQKIDAIPHSCPGCGARFFEEKTP